MDKKYLLDTEENKKFLEEIRKDLLEFGCQFPAVDGTCYYLGDDGTPWKEYNRETYATSRMVHVYTLGKYMGYKGSDRLIDSAVKGLMGSARDKKKRRLVFFTHPRWWTYRKQIMLCACICNSCRNRGSSGRTPEG